MGPARAVRSTLLVTAYVFSIPSRATRLQGSGGLLSQWELPTQTTPFATFPRTRTAGTLFLPAGWTLLPSRLSVWSPCPASRGASLRAGTTLRQGRSLSTATRWTRRSTSMQLRNSTSSAPSVCCTIRTPCRRFSAQRQWGVPSVAAVILATDTGTHSEQRLWELTPLAPTSSWTPTSAGPARGHPPSSRVWGQTLDGTYWESPAPTGHGNSRPVGPNSTSQGLMLTPP